MGFFGILIYKHTHTHTHTHLNDCFTKKEHFSSTPRSFLIFNESISDDCKGLSPLCTYWVLDLWKQIAVCVFLVFLQMFLLPLSVVRVTFVFQCPPGIQLYCQHNVQVHTALSEWLEYLGDPLILLTPKPIVCCVEMVHVSICIKGA